MKVNRNTINGDIDYLYSIITKKINIFVPEIQIITSIEKMNAQLGRLRELLDKANNISERTSIERLMYDVNSKILYTWQKIASSAIRSNTIATKWFNEKLKKEKRPERHVSLYDTMTVSKKAHEKINRIINEDRNISE